MRRLLEIEKLKKYFFYFGLKCNFALQILNVRMLPDFNIC